MVHILVASALLLVEAHALSWSLRDLTFRSARGSEAPLILARLVRDKMNPLGVEPDRFLLAWDKPRGSVAGFGQIRPLGDEACELASLIVEKQYQNFGIGTLLVVKLLARHRASVSWAARGVSSPRLA